MKRKWMMLAAMTAGTAASLAMAAPAPHVFWNMEVEFKGEKAALSVDSVRQTCETQGDRVVYGPLRCGDRTLDMKVSVKVRDTPDAKVYSGVVENNDQRVRVTMFNGPKLGMVSIDPAKAHLYIPEGFGRRVNHFPLDAQDGAPWQAKSPAFMYFETKPYPSRSLTMPWAAIDTGSDTWYAAVHDAKERMKKIGVRWYSREKIADVRFRHPVSIRAGEKWELPETVFEKVPGGWHDAAKRYRAWFDSAHNAVRSAAPDWTSGLTGWLLVIMKQQNEELMWPYTDIPKLCDVAERNGLNAIGLFGWTVGGHDHLYPDYDADPKMGGAEALKAGIAEAHRRGIRVCIYANGQLQQVGATKFWGEHGERIAVRRRDGTPYIQTYHKYKDIPVYKFAIGCLYGTAWHDRMFALAKQARGFGADAILYDQLGVTMPFECWGEGHGHPVPWHSHCAERPGFVRRIADEMHVTDKDFAVFTEGLHDGLLDTIGMFHAFTPGAFMSDVNALKASRTSSRAKSEPFPELFRYTFPELVTTTRNPTPMALRSFVNYAAVFGLRHEIEIRYMPDRAYALDGKVPERADYGEVKNLPSLAAMAAEQPAIASAYMKAVADFQRAHAKYLMCGRFVDGEGFAVRGDGIVAKRFIADDGTSAVCVWNVSDKPVDVAIDGLGKPKGVFAPKGEGTEGPLVPDAIRLYVWDGKPLPQSRLDAAVRAELAVRTLPESAKNSSIDAVFAEVAAADKACDEAWRTCATKEELFVRGRKMREEFIKAVGGFPEKRCPLNAKTVAVVKRDGYIVEKVLFESWPGVHVAANLFLPDDPKHAAPYPAVLLACGHTGNGKGADMYQRGCVLAAKSGMACLIYDPFDQGERRQGKDGSVHAHNRVGALAALLGGSMARFRIWDGMRCLDYLESRPEVDASRMGVMGQSGGGTMSSLLMATEPRLKASSPSCYISTYTASARNIGPGDAEQNTFGQFAIGVNNASFALMQAPLAVRFQFCHSDYFPFRGSLATFGLVRDVASKFGLAERYDMTDVDGGHGWKESTRTSSVEWMRRWLYGDKDALKHDLEGYRALDKTFDPKTGDMGVCNGGELVCPKGKVLNLPGERTVYDLLREEYSNALAARKAKVTADDVRRIAGIRNPGEEKVVRKELSRKTLEGGIEVTRLSYAWPDGVVVPAVVFVPSNVAKGTSPLLAIADDGKTARMDAVCKALGEGRVVVTADLIGKGEVNGVRHRFYGAKENEEEAAVLLYVLGKSIVGVQAGEILEIANGLKSAFEAPVEVGAFGRVSIAAAHARFVRPDLVSSAHLVEPPPSWGDSVKSAARVPFANVVNGALRLYDWVDL